MNQQPSLAPTRVTFDLTRIVRARRAGAGNFGITKYAYEIARRLSADPRIAIAPTYDGYPYSRTQFLKDARHFRGLRGELGMPIFLSRRDFPFPLSRLHRPPLNGLRHWVNSRTGLLPDRVPEPPGTHLYFSPHSPLPSRAEIHPRAERVITIHDVLHLKFPHLHQSPGKPYIQLVLDSIDPRRDHIICDTEVTRQDLLELLPMPQECTQVVHLAADDLFYDYEHNRLQCLDLLAANNLRPGDYVLALAQDDKRKNIESLVNAYAALDQTRRDALPLALVASHNGSEERVRQWLHEARVAELQYRVLRDVSTEQLSQLYAAARLFVYPSWYEGFGIPLVEAMASGCPILASNTSTHPEVLADAAMMFDPHKSSALPEALAALVDRTDKLQDYRARGLARAKRFSWSNTSDRTVEFLLDIARKHATRT